jgi:molecular chaperone DnaJ
MRDAYEVLGVERSADADSIKKAYRKLAMQYHPDRNPGDKEAEDKFKEAAAAYEVLSSPEKKAQYDRFGWRAFQNGGGGQGGGFGGFADVEDIFSSFGDIFGDIFGGGGGSRSRQNRNSARRGSDLRYRLQIDLKDVVFGVEKEINFETEEDCGTCNGSGIEKGKQPQICGTCGGQGQVRVSQGFFQMLSTCPTCQGAGQIIKDPCKACKGRGRLKQERKIKISVPPGVDTGTRLRVSGEGEGGYRGGTAGDLYVEIHVKEDKRFERDGDTLHTEINPDYLFLALGGSLNVETITGTATLKIPKGSQVGERLKISGEGLPNLRSGRRGDLILTLGVSFPEKLTKEEEQLLRQVAEKRGLSLDGAEGSKSSSQFGFWSKKKS